MSLRAFFSIVWIIQAARSEYYVEQMTLNETSPQCSVAVPNIIYSARGNSLQLPNDDVHIADNTPVIVGYVKRMKTFRYVGCMVDSDIPYDVKRKIDITSDPGQCYTVCNYSNWFGVSVTSCYCFQRHFQERTNYTRCTQLCSFPKGALCGRSEQHRYISLYENVSYNGALNIGEGANCLACKNTTCLWTNCGNQLRGVCNGTSSSNVTDEATRYTWADYTNVCLRRYGYPKIPPIASSVFGKVGNDEYLWTGIMRSLVIEKRNEVPVTDFRHDYIGYIVKEGPRFNLDFAHTVTGKYLCYSNGTRAFPSIQTQPSTGGATSTTSTGLVSGFSSSTSNVDASTVTTSPTASQHINNTGYTPIPETVSTDSLTTTDSSTTASLSTTTDPQITTDFLITADSPTTERNGPATNSDGAVYRNDHTDHTAHVDEERHSSLMIVVYVATPLTVVALAIGIGYFIRWEKMRRSGKTGSTVLYYHNKTAKPNYDHLDARGVRNGAVDSTSNRTLQCGSDDCDTAGMSTRPAVTQHGSVVHTYAHSIAASDCGTVLINMAQGSDAF